MTYSNKNSDLFKVNMNEEYVCWKSHTKVHWMTTNLQPNANQMLITLELSKDHVLYNEYIAPKWSFVQITLFIQSNAKIDEP